MLAPAQQLISLTGNLLHDRLIIPLRVCQHVLKRLVIGSNNVLFHPLHVLKRCLHEPLEVVGG